MGQLYQEHHEEDFFLYIAYSDESVYGSYWMLPYKYLYCSQISPWNLDGHKIMNLNSLYIDFLITSLRFIVISQCLSLVLGCFSKEM